ncbi:MAG: hypothetical protein M4579_004460 [Chaenotheca gracillima]|nr:MAG: hypothetical protein M4579_004460 [Chaenotheca gracillima]
MMFKTITLLCLSAGLAVVSAAPQIAPPNSGFDDCAGSDGELHSDILACPAQPGAVGIICVSGSISGTGIPCGTDNGGGCSCINGNFCCSQGSNVAGGESAKNYFNDVACNCQG